MRLYMEHMNINVDIYQFFKVTDMWVIVGPTDQIWITSLKCFDGGVFGNQQGAAQTHLLCRKNKQTNKQKNTTT